MTITDFILIYGSWAILLIHARHQRNLRSGAVLCTRHDNSAFTTVNKRTNIILIFLYKLQSQNSYEPY